MLRRLQTGTRIEQYYCLFMAALKSAVFALNTIIVDARLFFGYNNINATIIKRKNYRNGEIYQNPILPDTKRQKLYTVKIQHDLTETSYGR